MGRQLQLATTPADAVLLVTAIHEITPCRLFSMFTATPDDLWIDAWNEETLSNVNGFTIWPTMFDWTPTFALTGGPKCPPARRGFWYVSNASAAPVIEFTGSDLARKRYGRLYWAKDFSAPNELAYDAAAFSRLVDRVFRWIRKAGMKRAGDKNSPYFLPDAWRLAGLPIPSNRLK